MWWFIGGVLVGVFLMGIVAGSGKSSDYSEAYNNGFMDGIKYCHKKDVASDKDGDSKI